MASFFFCILLSLAWQGTHLHAATGLERTDNVFGMLLKMPHIACLRPFFCFLGLDH